MMSYFSSVKKDTISFAALGDHSVRIEGRLSAILFHLSLKRFLPVSPFFPFVFTPSSLGKMHFSLRKGPDASRCFDSGVKYNRSTSPYSLKNLIKFIVRILPPVFSGNGYNKDIIKDLKF